jgi:4-methylaminobutanoate oxidase (formaldehyde-forming)
VTRAADVVVVGSGGLGSTTAFSLARRGCRVVVLERHEIASQTSPRAAGMVSYLRKSELLIDLVKLAGERIRRFAGDTGQPLDWVRPGSLKVARRAADVAVLEDDLRRGRTAGLDAELITPAEAHRLHPFLEPDGVEAALRVGEDMYFDPAHVAIGYARAAQAAGAEILTQIEATRVVIEDGAVCAVETSAGVIETPVVVDAAGAWTRQVAAASGVDVPLVTTRQQLFVTEAVDGARPDLPLLRIMDAAVYLRPHAPGFLWGVYEEDPLFFDAGRIPGTVTETPLDADILWRAADDVARQLPFLRGAGVREHRGGLPTMTADGGHIVGPAPGVTGFHFASGCNVAGLSMSPALGELLAAWIVDGAPPVDLAPLTLARFEGRIPPDDELRRDAAWQYRHFYGAV